MGPGAEEESMTEHTRAERNARRALKNIGSVRRITAVEVYNACPKCCLFPLAGAEHINSCPNKPLSDDEKPAKVKVKRPKGA